MNEKYQYDWSLSNVGNNEYEYTYATRDGEVKVSYTKDWSTWDGYNQPLRVAFQVQVLSGENEGDERDYYFYSEARQERDRLLAEGICAVMRYVK